MFLDVMVDCETTGTNSHKHGMLQLSAVKFDIETRSVQPYPEMFDRCLQLPASRTWDAGTAQWWQKKRRVYDEITARAEDPAIVIRDFAQWVGYQNPKPVRFWAKPTTFDWSFVASYFEEFGLPNPFHYRWATDMNTFIRGLAKDHTLESHYVPSLGGDAHNALYDNLNQINQVFEAMDTYASH